MLGQGELVLDWYALNTDPKTQHFPYMTDGPKGMVDQVTFG